MVCVVLDSVHPSGHRQPEELGCREPRQVALGACPDPDLVLGQEGLPTSMAVILVIGAVVTVGFAYLFAVDNGRVHALMIASLAVLVALLLLLEFQLGRPFQGVSAIEPTAMQLVLAEIDADTGIPGMNS